jgi:hypothetical protein
MDGLGCFAACTQRQKGFDVSGPVNLSSHSKGPPVQGPPERVDPNRRRLLHGVSPIRKEKSSAALLPTHPHFSGFAQSVASEATQTWRCLKGSRIYS